MKFRACLVCLMLMTQSPTGLSATKSGVSSENQLDSKKGADYSVPSAMEESYQTPRGARVGTAAMTTVGVLFALTIVGLPVAAPIVENAGWIGEEIDELGMIRKSLKSSRIIRNKHLFSDKKVKKNERVFEAFYTLLTHRFPATTLSRESVLDVLEDFNSIPGKHIEHFKHPTQVRDFIGLLFPRGEAWEGTNLKLTAYRNAEKARQS